METQNLGAGVLALFFPVYEVMVCIETLEKPMAELLLLKLLYTCTN